MSRWRAWRKKRADDRRRKAYDRLHGVGAVSRPPARRSSSAFDSDDLGDFLVDIAMALPRLALWAIAKILD